jgi:hypothetical protein
VNLKQVDRSLLVELKEGDSVPAPLPVVPAVEQEEAQPGSDPVAVAHGMNHPAPQVPQTPASPAQVEEGVRAISDVFQNATKQPHWPMYLRNVKQFIKNVSPSFDERKYGFVNFLEAVRACGRAGVFRLERNRQGILRIFAGAQFPHHEGAASHAAPEKPPIFDIENELAEAEAAAAAAAAAAEEAAPVEMPEPIGEVVDEPEPVEAAEEEAESEAPVKKKRTRAAAGTAKKKSTTPRKTKKKAAEPDED